MGKAFLRFSLSKCAFFKAYIVFLMDTDNFRKKKQKDKAFCYKTKTLRGEGI